MRWIAIIFLMSLSVNFAEAAYRQKVEAADCERHLLSPRGVPDRDRPEEILHERPEGHPTHEGDDGYGYGYDHDDGNDNEEEE